jgi:hypothetical protein
MLQVGIARGFTAKTVNHLQVVKEYLNHRKLSTNFNLLCSLRGWLHERFSACDLLQIADAIWCICDLVSDKNHLLSFFCTKSQMRFSVSAIWCGIWCPHSKLQHYIATPYCMLRVNGSNSVCDTKSQIHQIVSAICSKSDMKSHTKLLV